MTSYTNKNGPTPFDVGLDADTPVYIISVAAELTGLHPQTLRTYDRLGLVTPNRTGGGGRLYSLRDIETLRHVTRLTAAGIGLEGVKRILELEAEVTELRTRVFELQEQLPDEHPDRRRRAPAPPPSPYALERLPQHTTAVVLWSKRNRP